MPGRSILGESTGSPRIEATLMTGRRNPLLGLSVVADNEAMSEPQTNRFNKGDPVRINDGTFKGFVGVVDIVNEPKGYATVFIQVPGVRGPTPVRLEVRQLDRA
jgi:transcription antitermination factor NusG